MDSPCCTIIRSLADVPGLQGNRKTVGTDKINQIKVREGLLPLIVTEAISEVGRQFASTPELSPHEI